MFPVLEFAQISYVIPAKVFQSDGLNSALFIAYTNISSPAFKATEHSKNFTCLTHVVHASE